MSDDSSDSAPPKPDVGYGQPPTHSQFKKGASGNPKGRPRGAKNFRTELNKVLNETFPIEVQGRKRRIKTTEVILRTQRKKAFQGDPRASATMLRYAEMEQQREDVAAAEKAQRDVEAEDIALLQAFLLRNGPKAA